MFYISLIMGALVGFLTDFWLGRFALASDPTRRLLALVVAIVVTVFTYSGVLAHF